jgi:hypothetical protein
MLHAATHVSQTEPPLTQFGPDANGEKTPTLKRTNSTSPQTPETFMMTRDRPIERHALMRGLTVALLLLLGCGDDAAAPSGRELVGTWGSIEARTELIALLAGAELRVPCTTFIIDDPIVLDDTNGFATRAKVRTGAVLGDLPVVRLTGSLGSDRVTVAVPLTESTFAITYLLDLGVTVPPADLPECPG